ncbi:MAG TPA: hypothetical protein VMR17_01755 [Xanthobacteraceae bacterium]|nr:hypothetical protein [Xanthobacteraceae bacterium]
MVIARVVDRERRSFAQNLAAKPREAINACWTNWRAVAPNEAARPVLPSSPPLASLRPNRERRTKSLVVSMGIVVGRNRFA